MMNKLIGSLLLLSLGACAQGPSNTILNKASMSANKNQYYSTTNKEKLVLPDSTWKQVLSPEVYQIAREKGTERPFSSAFENSKEVGTFHCAACGNPLFKSTAKFESGCGWPSFYQSIDKSKVKEITDNSHGISRVEVVCNNCGGHLGHVFNDGYNQPTGLRYCINGVSLGFVKKQ